MKKCAIIRKHPHIGDFLMMTPAIRELSKEYIINLVVPKEFKEVFYNLYYVHEIFEIENIFDVKTKDYDRIFEVNDYEYNYEYLMQPLITKNRVELFCESMGIEKVNSKLDIILTKKEIEWAKNFLTQRGDINRKTIILAIKSTSESRDWNLNKWKLLINNLKKLKFNLVVVDKTVHWNDEEIFFFNNHSVRELFAITSISDYIICNDSSLLHIGSALNKKTLGIFGPTDPRIRCIYDNSYEIHNNLNILPCWYNRDKEKDYFSSISVEDVERKFIEIIQDG